MKKKTILKSFFLVFGLTLSMSFMLAGCVKDEPVADDERIEGEYSEEVDPSDPEGEQPSDDDPDSSGETENEGDSSKYYTPNSEDLLGPWCVCWEKYDDWIVINGKWTRLKSYVWSEEDGHERYKEFPYYLALFEYTVGESTRNRLVWDWSHVCRYYDILSALENKENATFKGWYGNLQVENGEISGDYYIWEWHPDINDSRSMLVLLDKNKKVRCRWEISDFDGETFVLTDYFEDWKNTNKEGATHYEYTRKYRRMSEIVNDKEDSAK